MKTRNKKPLSIYIHIPFCKRKCLYCDFLSAPACAMERERYVKALLREIPLRKEDCRDYEVISVFFGGGTPSLLTKGQLKRIMDTLRSQYKFKKCAEISMECNPATATLDKLTAYRECGINRLSIGLQSANDTELIELGRIHNYRQFLQTYEAARKAGFLNINIDIMSALPGQTLDSYLETLYKVTALKPEHISAYSLIIEEGTPFFERYGESDAGTFTVENKETVRDVPVSGEQKAAMQMVYPALPDEDTERLMYYKTNRILQKAGYNRYEISNFAKRGYECRHNLTYWTGIHYLGFGVGAASYFQGVRYKNISDVGKYREIFASKGGRKQDRESLFSVLQQEVQPLSEAEQMEEFMFLGLRLKKGVRTDDFQYRFCVNIEEIYGTVMNRLVKEGVLIRSKNRIYLSKKGTDVANYVMSEFLLS